MRCVLRTLSVAQESEARERVNQRKGVNLHDLKVETAIRTAQRGNVPERALKTIKGVSTNKKMIALTQGEVYKAESGF